jgi:hypothetical protein
MWKLQLCGGDFMFEDKKIKEESIMPIVDYYKVLRKAEGIENNTLLATLNPTLEEIIKE